MKKNKVLTIEIKLKRCRRWLITLLILLILVIGTTCTYIYMNYDYLTFKHFISQFYIYDETLDELYQKEIGMDVNGNYYSYFDDVVISIVTKQIREINNDKYTYLYNPEHYEKHKQEEKEEAMESRFVSINEKTAYMFISNFSKYTKEFVYDNINEMGKYPFIIIDLRNNYGGDIDSMVDISDVFLPRKSIVAIDKMRFLKWTYKTKKRKMVEFEKIIILQNKNTASASENMIAALNDNLDNVLLVGEPTFGKGIGQYTLPLKKGFAVKATILMWYTPNGQNIHGEGIEPEITYTGSDILQFALNKLNE